MLFCGRSKLFKFLLIIITLSLVIIFIFSRTSDNALVKGEVREYLRKYSKCEAIHLGVVSIGYSSNVDFHTMLKSLYFYRNNPLHFHILVDDISENILKTVFKTWDVPQVSATFYNINNLTLDLTWLPKTQNYLETQILLKLMLPTVIPTDVTTKIIIMDTDLIFVSNVYDLWNLFDNFKKNEVLGLIENQRNDDTNIANSKKFDTTVMLFDLKYLETTGWHKMWLKYVNQTASSFVDLQIPTQNVINEIITSNLGLLYSIPCYWNSDLKSNYKCYNNNKIKILKTSKDLNNKGEYYGKIYNTLINYNGSLFRQLDGCDENLANFITVQPLNDNCSDFYEMQIHKWRTLPFFREFTYNATKNDLTFVSQLSYNRLNIVEELTKLWEGPMSLTIYLNDTELPQAINFINNSTALKKRFNIAYHAVFNEGMYYPINELRNIALRRVITPYVFLVDADFLPMPGSYKSLKKQIGNMDSLERKALIVPAFETKTKVPKTKPEALDMLDNKTIFFFHQNVYRPAHSPTNFTKWRTANEPYKVRWKPDFEPYIVTQRNVTEYDNRFFGYGWNKVSHIMELKEQHYEFIVVPNAFVVHKNHKVSRERRKFLRSRKQQKCLQKLKRRFVKEIKEKYRN